MDEGESEYSIVAVKQGNSPRRILWRGGGTEFTGLLEVKMAGRSSPTTVSTRLWQIADLAGQAPDMVLTTLAHHIDVELLREAYGLTRKSGAVGVNGQTATAYAENLEGNLQSLLDRFKSGTYKAPPVRRSHIPKGGSEKTRPIGVPTFEDKVLQRAVVMVLEDGSVRFPNAGTPQGRVVFPLLANIYLHHVVDLWFEEVVRPRLMGRAFLIRYADDVVIVFSLEKDARRVLDVLGKRLGKYGLSLHPEKTRLVMFRPSCERLGRSKRPGSFDFLGFTHHWCRSFKGYWVVKRRTAKDRFRRALKEISQWCRQHRHLPVAEHQRVLTWKLRGYSQYYGITGNGKAVSKFFRQVVHVWQKWLSRRSQRSRLNWERFNRLLARYPLPAPVMVHSLYRRAVNP